LADFQLELLVLDCVPNWAGDAGADLTKLLNDLKVLVNASLCLSTLLA
jgi:hypothetical protein